MTAEGTPRLCLQGNAYWAGFDREGLDALPGRWVFIGTNHNPDPAQAARVLAGQKWASGKHRILVVCATKALEFEITLETRRV